MPLKLRPPRKGKTPNWTIVGTYLGQHVERSAGTGKRQVAAKILAGIERDIERGAYSQPGEPTFASAAMSYMQAGGEKRFLKPLLEHFGETKISQIDQAGIDAAAISLCPNVSPASRNRAIYTPISAVLRHGGVRVDLRRPRGSAGNRQTGWLWPEQAEALIAEAHKINPAFAALLTVLLYTGMRLGEALGLTWNDVRLEEGYAYVADTKNGTPRPVFLPPVAVAAMVNLPRVGPSGRERRVAEYKGPFRLRAGGHLYSLLFEAAERAGVELPDRSAFHLLRHTYATWMRRYAGADETALISTGAWRDKKSVARYTHTVVSEDARRAALLPTPKPKVKEV